MKNTTIIRTLILSQIWNDKCLKRIQEKIGYILIGEMNLQIWMVYYIYAIMDVRVSYICMKHVYSLKFSIKWQFKKQLIITSLFI